MDKLEAVNETKSGLGLDEDRSRRIEELFQPLDHFDISVGSESEDGFSVSVKSLEGKTAAGFHFTRIKNFDNLPEDLESIIRKLDSQRVFVGSIFTNDKFKKQGVGTALWQFGILRLLSKEGTFLHLVEDNSRERAGEVPWTSRTLPKILENFKEIGIESEIIWKGVVDNGIESMDASLVRYTWDLHKKARENPLI